MLAKFFQRIGIILLACRNDVHEYGKLYALFEENARDMILRVLDFCFDNRFQCGVSTLL